MIISYLLLSPQTSNNSIFISVNHLICCFTETTESKQKKNSKTSHNYISPSTCLFIYLLSMVELSVLLILVHYISSSLTYLSNYSSNSFLSFLHCQFFFLPCPFYQPTICCNVSTLEIKKAHLLTSLPLQYHTIFLPFSV